MNNKFNGLLRRMLVILLITMVGLVGCGKSGQDKGEKLDGRKGSVVEEDLIFNKEELVFYNIDQFLDHKKYDFKLPRNFVDFPFNAIRFNPETGMVNVEYGDIRQDDRMVLSISEFDEIRALEEYMEADSIVCDYELLDSKESKIKVEGMNIVENKIGLTGGDLKDKSYVKNFAWKESGVNYNLYYIHTNPEGDLLYYDGVPSGVEMVVRSLEDVDRVEKSKYILDSPKKYPIYSGDDLKRTGDISGIKPVYLLKVLGEYRLNHLCLHKCKNTIYHSNYIPSPENNVRLSFVETYEEDNMDYVEESFKDIYTTTYIDPDTDEKIEVKRPYEVLDILGKEVYKYSTQKLVIGMNFIRREIGMDNMMVYSWIDGDHLYRLEFITGEGDTLSILNGEEDLKSFPKDRQVKVLEEFIRAS